MRTSAFYFEAMKRPAAVGAQGRRRATSKARDSFTTHVTTLDSQRFAFGSGCTAGHCLSARRFTAPEAGSEPHTASAQPTLGDLEPRLAKANWAEETKRYGSSDRQGTYRYSRSHAASTPCLSISIVSCCVAPRPSTTPREQRGDLRSRLELSSRPEIPCKRPLETRRQFRSQL